MTYRDFQGSLKRIPGEMQREMVPPPLVCPWYVTHGQDTEREVAGLVQPDVHPKDSCDPLGVLDLLKELPVNRYV